MKPISMVLDALKQGCSTATEVQAVTGLAKRKVNGNLKELEAMGLIRNIGYASYLQEFSCQRHKTAKQYVVIEA